MTTGNALRSGGLWAGLVLAAVLAVVPLAGCGRGYHYSPYFGTVEIENDATSSFDIDFVDISVPFGPIDHHHVFLEPGDSAQFDLRPDSYDIDVYWSNGDVHTYYDYEVFDGDFTTITAFHG